MVFSIPPLMVLIPATLPLSVQVTAAVFCLVAALSVIVNSFIEPDLGALHSVLALGAIIGMGNGYCNEPRKRRHHYCRQCGFS
jgi:ribose/xylose/arabinose/galactoside ABC-type transport system permease subunit